MGLFYNITTFALETMVMRPITTIRYGSDKTTDGYLQTRSRFEYSLKKVVARVQSLRTDCISAATIHTLQGFIKALCCRRIWGVSANGLAEPTDYCDQTRKCPRCEFLRGDERAEHRVSQITFKPMQKAYHLVLTTPASHAEADELKSVRFVWNAKRKLAAHLRKARDTQYCRFPLLEYLIGIHCKRTKNCIFLSCHLHLVMRLESGCDRDILIHSLEDLWQTLTVQEFGASCRTIWVLTDEEISPSMRPHPGAISIKHYKNTLSYAMRRTEKDDTPEVAVRREQLFEFFDGKPSYSASNTKHATFKQSSTSHFPPEPLGKESIVVWNFAGRPRQLEPKHYLEQKKRIAEEATELVMNSLPLETIRAWLRKEENEHAVSLGFNPIHPGPISLAKLNDSVKGSTK